MVAEIYKTKTSVKLKVYLVQELCFIVATQVLLGSPEAEHGHKGIVLLMLPSNDARGLSYQRSPMSCD